MVMPSHSDAESPLLQGTTTVYGFVDYKGRPAFRSSSSGGWRSASFILVVEIAERFAYFGISTNLITYLTGPLGQSNAVAAKNVNVWSGVGSLMPLFGALVADSFLGRYRTIVISSIIYILGLGLLTLSALLLSQSSSKCQSSSSTTLCYPHHVQVLLFLFSLYMVSVAQGGHKPCVEAFGADQFDEQDPELRKTKSSFFNWWPFGCCAVSAVTLPVLSYIQENISWPLGFGIPCIAMIVALIVFLLGTKNYWYSIKESRKKGPFSRIGKVYVAAIRNWRTSPSVTATELEALGISPHPRYKFLNKALLATDGSKEEQKTCTLTEVEEAKALLGLFPIWATSLVYAVPFAQTVTFFTRQGATMDRTIAPGFIISAASLLSFTGLTMILLIPVYDHIFVPLARALTGKPSGITLLQRIGTGIFLSCLSMAVAALVEMKRLKTAQVYGLVDMPNVTIPMSVWWLIPQYMLSGAADVFTNVGLQEFFYGQVPHELRSVGISLFFSIVGVGSLLSSFIVSVIDRATGGDGGDSWFANNLNRAHLDYFYWLLTGLSAVNLAAYLYFSKSYIYNRNVLSSPR